MSTQKTDRKQLIVGYIVPAKVGGVILPMTYYSISGRRPGIPPTTPLKFIQMHRSHVSVLGKKSFYDDRYVRLHTDYVSVIGKRPGSGGDVGEYVIKAHEAFVSVLGSSNINQIPMVKLHSASLSVISKFSPYIPPPQPEFVGRTHAVTLSVLGNRRMSPPPPPTEGTKIYYAENRVVVSHTPLSPYGSSHSLLAYLFIVYSHSQFHIDDEVKITDIYNVYLLSKFRWVEGGLPQFFNCWGISGRWDFPVIFSAPPNIPLDEFVLVPRRITSVNYIQGRKKVNGIDTYLGYFIIMLELRYDFWQSENSLIRNMKPDIIRDSIYIAMREFSPCLFEPGIVVGFSPIEVRHNRI